MHGLSGYDRRDSHFTGVVGHLACLMRTLHRPPKSQPRKQSAADLPSRAGSGLGVGGGLRLSLRIVTRLGGVYTTVHTPPALGWGISDREFTSLQSREHDVALMYSIFVNSVNSQPGRIGGND